MPCVNSDTIDNLVISTRNYFEYDEGDEVLKIFYEKAFAENRFIYLYKDDECIGYLVFYLLDKEGIDYMLQKKGGFNFPEHKKDGQYLYVEDCVVFRQFR